MKRVFNRFALSALVFFLAMTAVSVAREEVVVERNKKYKNRPVFICQTRAGAKLARDHMQSFADVARNERAKPLPFPKDANCGPATVTLEVVGYADELLNGEGVGEEGNIIKARFLIINVSEPFIWNGAFIRAPIRMTIKGIDPPEKRAE